MKLFKVIKNEDVNNNDITHIKIYASNDYILRILKYKSGYIQVNIRKNPESKLKYLPHLLADDNLDTFKIKDIKIDITGYGYVVHEEIEKVIEGYKVAANSVLELREELNSMDLLEKGK